MKKPRRVVDEDEIKVDLAISPEKVCFLIIKAREFDAKDEVSDPDSGSNPADDMDAAILEDHADDPVVEEMTTLIDSLSEDEQIDLVAIAWLGMPLLGDYLEEGLSLLGRDCEEYEIGRL